MDGASGPPLLLAPCSQQHEASRPVLVADGPSSGCAVGSPTQCLGLVMHLLALFIKPAIAAASLPRKEGCGFCSQRPAGRVSFARRICSWLATLNFFTPIVGVLTLGCVQHVCSQWLPLAARPSGVVRPRPLGRCGLPRVRDLCSPRHRRRWGGRRRCFWLRRSGCAVWPIALFVIVAGGQKSPGGRRRKVPSMHPLPHARGIGVVELQCKYS